MDQTVPAYAAEVADYGRSRDPEPGEGALVKNVRPESPAWDVGIEPGMRVLTVNGEQLTDMIVWLWEADDDTVELEVFDPRDDTVTPSSSTASRARTGAWSSTAPSLTACVPASTPACSAL